MTTLRVRLVEFLDAAEQYANKEIEHARRQPDGLYLAGHGRGQLSLIREIRFLLRINPPEKDCD